MPLKEAIAIVQAYYDAAPGYHSNPWYQALGTLLEAGKRELILRREVPYDRDGLLPGETEE